MALLRTSASVVALQTPSRHASLDLGEQPSTAPAKSPRPTGFLSALKAKMPPSLPPLEVSASKASVGGKAGSSAAALGLAAAKAAAKATVKTSEERDRINRERAERVKAFIEERDKSRPILPAYVKAVRSTLDLNPSSVADTLPPRRNRVGAGKRYHPTTGIRIVSKELDSSKAADSSSKVLDTSQLGDLTVSLRQINLASTASLAPAADVAWLLPPIDDGEAAPAPAPKKKKARRKKAKDMAKSATALIRGKDHDRESGFSTRVLDERLLPASEQLMQGLDRWPEDQRMRDGFDEVMQNLKMYEGQQRYSSFLFGGCVEVAAKSASGGSPPDRMRAPCATVTEATSDSSTLTWEAIDNSTGYELEVANVNAIQGAQDWRKVYRGASLRFVVTNIGREFVGIRARVRAYNNHGKGEWSPRSELLRMKAIPPPDRKEIEEMPGSWLTIDLAGVPELSGRDVNPDLLHMTKRDLVQAFHANRTVIKVAFRYYALAGVSNVDDDPSTMTMVQFGNFCRETMMISQSLSGSDIDRIFLRAVRVLPTAATSGSVADVEETSLVSALASAGVKATKEWRKAKAAVSMVSLLGKGANLMSQPQFVQALVRLAAARYQKDEELSLADKLSRLLKEQVENLVLHEMQLIEDDFSPRMRTRAMGAVLERHSAELEQVFMAYAAADQLSSAAAKRALSTMNVIECHEMCEDIGIFDDTFGTRDMLAAFVKVNIDDDLYYQEQADNSSSELVFDEFEEVLARIFNTAVWSHVTHVPETMNLLDQDGDGDLDEDDVDDLFDECDTDNSGSITTEEFRVVLAKRLNEEAARLVADQLVAFADADKSGAISRDELRDAVVKLASGKVHAKEQAEALERAFDSWLGTTFLPKALKAIKKKKLAPAAPPKESAAKK